MDNSNFEQQFTQNVKTTAMPPVPSMASEGTGKLPLIIAIILGVVTLIETIVLVITLSGHFAYLNSNSEVDYETAVEDDYVNSAYVYDKDYNLTALNLTCVASDGSTYELTTDNQFSQHDNNGSPIASGSYSITNDSLISLADTNKVLYFDGFDVADGLTVYTCKEVATETNSDDTGTE